jgi:hypothetical protein
MEIYISIDGVLRNLIQKFDYHYKDYFLEREEENSPVLIDINGNEIKEIKEKIKFEYGIDGKIQNDNLLDYFKFQSMEEFENFLYIEYPIEIFGHAGISYSTAITDLNNVINKNKEHNFTIIGVDEFGKAKPSTLFFLSRNGCLCDNIKFIKSKDLEKIWENCDFWVTDSEKIIKSCPKDKKTIKFKTIYNEYFTNPQEIDKLTEINELL